MTKKNTAAQPAIDGAFLAMLQNHRKGEVLSDLAAALRLVSNAVQLTGRPGAVTFKLTVQPASKGTAGALVVLDDIGTRLPKEDKTGSIFFADEAGNLVREDPNQMTMELRMVKGLKGDFKVLEAREAAV